MIGRVLELSLTADPLNPMDGGAVGGQQILVREAVRGLARQGVGADVFTYRQSRRFAPVGSQLAHMSRVVRIGSERDFPQEDIDWVAMADEIADRIYAKIQAEGSEYGLIHSHFWVSGMVAQELSERLKIPWIHSPYKMAKWIHRAGQPLPARRVEIERSLINEVAAVVVNYLDEGELIHADSPRTPLYVIPPAIESTTFFERDCGPVLKSLNLKRRPAIYVGRLSHGRGILGLLKEMSKRELPPEFCLLVLGGDRGEVVHGRPADPVLAQLKQSLGERVKFLGPMPHGAVAQYLSAAGVVLAPNQGPTLGMAVVEALACGKPVVGSRVTGVSDWITPGVDGLLYEPNDIEGMLSGALSLWQDGAKARMLGKAGYDKVHRHHSLDYMSEQLVRVYEEVMEGERVETGFGHGY
ncbi:MAG: glycosyltransferase [Firmicutes bacterium]|jgi:glycosyltransferase involved in cell wall biosynthesis|nr:glycosyltransferase [Bacillota bacterium]